MPATRAQIRWWQNMRQVCLGLGMPQSTLKHRSLQGSLSAPSANHNVVYTGPGPVTAEATTDTLVWAQWRPMGRGSTTGDDLPSGAIGLEKVIIQFPAIDDAGNVLAVTHVDFIVTPSGIYFRLEGPVLTPDNALWMATGERQR